MTGVDGYRRPVRTSKLSKLRSMIVFVVLAGVAVWLSAPAIDSSHRVALAYGGAAFAILLLKGIMSSAGTDPGYHEIGLEVRTRLAERFATVVVIPAHNEDPDILLQCVMSCLAQPAVRGIVLVDDASTDPEAAAAFEDIRRIDPRKIHLLRFETNKGKRWGLHDGVLHAKHEFAPDLIATVDSDTVLDRDAVEEGMLRLYSDDRCAAATGVVRARNWRTNTLTRLQDLRYAAAFLWERAAYSRVGSVLCVCGSFTLWRAPVLERLVVPLVEQRFLGEECTYGDDRHLTNLALAEGWRVRLAERAIADTLVPERFGHWVRQQTRWSRSFIRESWWAIRNVRGWPWVLTVVEVVSWLVFTAALIVALVVAPIATGRFAVAGWVVWVAVMSWARSARFTDSRADAGVVDRWFSLLLAPVYGVVHLLVVVPLRFWALGTMRRTAWGTRSAIEVTA